jgi:hypothetical protein
MLMPTLLGAQSADEVSEFIRQELRNFIVPGADDNTAYLLDLGRQWDLPGVPDAVGQARRARAIAEQDSKVAALTARNAELDAAIDAALTQDEPEPVVAEPEAPPRVNAEFVRKIAEWKRDHPEAVAAEAVEDFDDDVDEDDEAEPVRAGLPVPVSDVMLPVAAAERVQIEGLNKKHCVIGNYGGKSVVLSYERWPLNSAVMVPTFQGFGDFRNRYLNCYVERHTDGGTKLVSAGKAWLAHPKRLTYESVVFEPSEPVVLPGNRLNLWREFAVAPAEGNWELLSDHIYEVLGAGDPQAGDYIVRWLAWTLQNPGRAAEVVLVLQGEEGSGKGTLARVMLKIFGPCGLPISDPKHLVGAFSGHLHHCVFMFLDEAFWAGNVAAEGRLKSLVTEETIMIEPKYFGAFPIRNLLHIMMASNNDWVVPAGHAARRYAVFKVSDAVVGNFAYFAALNAELEAGGAAAMLYDLLRLDLGGWHPKQIYATAALAQQKQHSLRGLDAWIEDMLQRGCLPVPVQGYPNRCLSMHLLDAAKKFDRYTTASRIAKKLQDLFGVYEFNNQVRRGWAFPSLAECRQIWEARNGGQWPWHHDVPQWRQWGDE